MVHKPDLNEEINTVFPPSPPPYLPTAAGACIGEVALVSENCMRTASCIASTLCEFVVIDRALYAVSVKEVIEKEFQDKTNFVERNPFFK